MDRKRIIQIAFIFFSLGLSIELLKNLSAKSELVLEPQAEPLRMEDYNVNLGTDVQLHTTPYNPQLLALKIKKEDKKPWIPSNKALKPKKDDKKDSKKVAKKKKKKKKKKTEENKETEVAKKTDTPKSDDASPVMGNMTNTFVPAVPGAPMANASEWERKLLGEPSYKDVVKFIELRRSKQISDETYFNIAKQMLNDTRTQIRDYGLIILESYASVKSFEIVAEAYFHEPGGSDLRAKMEKVLTAYGRVDQFAFLASALGKEKPNEVNNAAIMVVDRALQRYRPQVRGPSAGPNSTTPNTPPAVPTPPVTPPQTNSPAPNGVTSNPRQQSTTATIFSAFSRLTTPLRQLMTEKDATLSRQASDLLAQIMAFIS